MAITFEKQSYSGAFPEIWRGECKMLPGGFKPKHDLPVDAVLRRATPVFVNFDDMSAAVCKVAKVLSGGTTSKVRIAKGNYFMQGDVVMKVGKTDASPTISSIDKSNADYDVLNLSSAITGLAADDIIAEATEYVAAQGESEAVPAALKYLPNAVVGADKHFDGKGLPTIDAAFEAVVLIPSLSVPVLPEWVTGIALKNNPNIIFIKQ